MCFPGGRTHYAADMCFQGKETNNLRDMCFQGGEHITLEKWPIFGAKPWTNPFKKISILRLFELLVFIA